MMRSATTIAAAVAAALLALGAPSEAEAACQNAYTLSSAKPLSLPAGRVGAKDATPRVCRWDIPTFGPPVDCGVATLRVEGAGPRPARINLQRDSDNVIEQGKQTVGPSSLYPGAKWSAQINFNQNQQLACNPGTCPTSSYTITTMSAVPPFICAQLVKLVIQLRR